MPIEPTVPANSPQNPPAGVARFPVDGADSEALIEAAMAALAQAKAAGQGSVAESEAVAEA